MSGIDLKYRIEKRDGTPIDPEACYFVLRLDTDPAARAAAKAYAENCDNDQLASDILNCLDGLAVTPCGCREAACPHRFIQSFVWQYGESEPKEGSQ